jgi:two-component system, cell cycle sensor histidine kinase and response regulator CckA
VSIAVKLPLFIGGLIAVVIATNTWGDYRAGRQEARNQAALRLRDVAQEFVFVLGRMRVEVARQLDTLARDREIRRYLLSDARTRVPTPVRARLQQLETAPQFRVVELRDSAGRLLVDESSAPGGTAPLLDPELLRQAAASDSAVVGRLEFLADSVVYPAVARIEANGRLAGFAVEWRRLIAAAATPTQIPMLIGTSGQVFVGNARDSVWTNLAAPAAPPPVALPSASTPTLMEYRRPGSGAVLAMAEFVPQTQWSVLVEFPTDSVDAPARADMRRLLVIDVVALLVGLLGAWGLSRQLTTRLGPLTLAAESMVADATPHDGSSSTATGDEVARLGRAFETMRNRVRQALAASELSEQLYRHLFESVPMPLYVTDVESLEFLAVNTAAVEHYGYTREEFLAMTLRDIRPAEDVARLETAIRSLGDDPEPRGTWRHIRKDGRVLAVEVIAHRLTFNGRPAVLTLAADITDRDRAAEALRRSEERYRRLIQEAPYGIELTTLEGQLIDANPALARMLGYERPEQLIGRSILDVYVNAAERETSLRDVQAHGYTHRESLHWKRRDGQIIAVRFSARLVRDSERAQPYIETIIEDVTDRLRLEEQFHQAQKMEAIGRLAGGIAHDFNNLLTVILTTTELLLDSESGHGPVHAELQDVYRSAQRGAELTRQLLAFSRRQVLTIHPMSVNHLVGGVERLLRRVLGEDIELRVVPGAQPDIVRADAGQVEQVLMNLAVNARDAMPQGGQLTIETAHLELAETIRERQVAMPAGSYVMIAVSDTGEGMPPEVKEHLFEPFFTTKGRDKGTGLGLATVFGIVKQLDGFIWVYSEVGLGTTFKIYLPRVEDAASAPASLPAIRRDEVSGRETVLVAEDEPGILQLLTRVLKSRGYTVLAAASGAAALEHAIGHTEPIHLLVTDVVMAGMSGPDLAREVAARHPEARVLFVSGYTDEAVVQHGLAARRVSFLQKPFTHNVFLLKVREVLDEPRPTSDRVIG